MTFRRILAPLAAAVVLAATAGAQAPEKQLRLPIVDKAIEFHGGPLFQRSHTTLTIASLSGSFDISARMDSGRFEYVVSGKTRSGERRVRWTNDSLERWDDGKPVPLETDEDRQRAEDFVNARVYFAFLPYRLNDGNTYKEDLGIEEYDGRKLHKVKVTFRPGTSTDADDEYMYWFDPDTGRMEQFAYSFVVGDGGLRLRKVTKFEEVGGILFAVEQENYAIDGQGFKVEQITPEYVAKNMKLLSTVTLKDIKVTPIGS